MRNVSLIMLITVCCWLLRFLALTPRRVLSQMKLDFGGKP